MSEPFLGEIRLVSFSFAPKGWAQCNGQLLAINQNQSLFSLLGTAFGGDGVTNFALPDYRGRVAVHQGTFEVGQRFGEAAHTLSTAEMPSHTHGITGVDATATDDDPTGNYLASQRRNDSFAPVADGTLAGSAIALTGGSQPHNNLQPYLVLNYVIAIQGLFPSRN
jgi:microcystin-dependent protein